MGWLDIRAGEGRRAPIAAMLLCLALTACGQNKPAFELAPTNDQVRQALQTRFNAAHDPAGAACSSDFILGGIAIREDAEQIVTRDATFETDVYAAYTATLNKPTSNLQALLTACFGVPVTGPATWASGETHPVFLEAKLTPAVNTGWTLAIATATTNAPETVALASAAAPHAYKLGLDGREAR